MSLVLLSLPWVITIVLYVLSKPSLGIVLIAPFQTAAQIAGLLGAVMLAQTYVMSTKARWLEALFGGLDKLYRIHHQVGSTAFILLIHHPVMLILGVLPNTTLALRYILPGPGNDLANNAGILALQLLTLLITLTLYVNLPYHVWKLSHEWMGGVVLSGLLHVFLVKSDVSRFFPLRIYMLSWLFVGLSAFIYTRFLYRFLGRRYQYEVAKVERSADVVNLTLKPEKAPIVHEPGQFVFLNALKETHPFSISSAPGEEKLRLSAKILGDYTLKLKDLEPGTKVKLYGAYGRFFAGFNSRTPALFIAGGIGITPFLSFLRSVQPSSEHALITLVVSDRNPEDSSHHDEIQSLVANLPFVTYKRHLSSKEGRLTAEKILADLPSESEPAVIYLCGPAPMMHSLRGQFVNAGYKRSAIKFEDFSFK